jgi:sugar-specific transcriptional regulator TrmB
MKENLIQLLSDLGYTEKQAVVYVSLLEIGESLPSTIARKSGLKRPTVYVILEQLKDRGLVSHSIKKKTTYFNAVDPQLLLEDQKRRFKRLEKSLPEFVGLRQRYAVTPHMSVFEGSEGIINIMEDTLKTEGEIYCWSSGNEAYEQQVFRDYHPRYVEKKNRKGIWIRGLFQYDEVGVDLKRKGDRDCREVYLIPGDKFPFENEINIYDDKVSIISHKDQVGVIIQNEAIANTQRSIFEFAFEYAKMLEPQILSDEHKAEFGYTD